MGRPHPRPRRASQDREIIDAFLALPAAQRKIVREVILAFAQTHPAKPGSPEQPGT